jgi:hypothetical protein
VVFVKNTTQGTIVINKGAYVGSIGKVEDSSYFTVVSLKIVFQTFAVRLALSTLVALILVAPY